MLFEFYDLQTVEVILEIFCEKWFIIYLTFVPYPDDTLLLAYGSVTEPNITN